MSSPILALRAAIRAACLPDAPLRALLGGAAEIRDEPPRGLMPVYAVFGDASCADWSTSSDRGHEQSLAIVVWAQPGSAASALAAADRIAALLDGAPLALAGHHLVQLAATALDTDRDAETGLARATLRLRATSEVAT